MSLLSTAYAAVGYLVSLLLYYQLSQDLLPRLVSKQCEFILALCVHYLTSDLTQNLVLMETCSENFHEVGQNRSQSPCYCEVGPKQRTNNIFAIGLSTPSYYIDNIDF